VSGSWVVASLLASGCGSSEAGSSGPPTVTEFCQSVGERYCAQDKPCCATLTLPFNEAACQLQFSAYCLRNASSVARGSAVFQPEKLDECVRGSQKFYDKCQLTNAEVQQSRASSVPCGEYFKGTVAENGACSVSADCAPGNFGAVCTNGACELIPSAPTFAETGDGCSVDTCDQGLTCSDPSAGVCIAGELSPIVTGAECSGTLMF
jgi:hypothetical protein